jgi:hypothetical protein
MKRKIKLESIQNYLHLTKYIYRSQFTIIVWHYLIQYQYYEYQYNRRTIRISKKTIPFQGEINVGLI